MSGGFTKARMILVTKVLIANKSFLEKFVSNSTLPFPGEIGTVHKSRDKYIFYIYRNLMEIFTSIITNFDTTISPHEFVSILYSFLFEDLKEIEVIQFPWTKKENSQMKKGIEKYGKPNRNTSKTTSGFRIIVPIESDKNSSIYHSEFTTHISRTCYKHLFRKDPATHKIMDACKKYGGNIYILPYSYTKLRNLQFNDMEYSIQVILVYFIWAILIFNNSNHTK